MAGSAALRLRRPVPAAPLDPAAFERLNGPAEAPVAVAVSGGGDSLALLLAAADWAERAARKLIVLTVDHRLHPLGADWAAFVAVRAARLGLAHRTLTWESEKPATGLPAAARAARHALLADAARQAGARVILLGHTADDVMEAQLMRRAGASTPSPRAWSPSPAWPEGRGVFLLRPLLGVRRAVLRAWLAGRGERWIEDPANDDERFARTLARRALADVEGEAPATADNAGSLAFLAGVVEGHGGELMVQRAAFAGAAAADARRQLSALLLCAAGTTRPPRGPALDRLLARWRAPGAFVATLGGARIEAGTGQVMVCREPGELRRRPLEPTTLGPHEAVFDGRFAVSAAAPGAVVAPLSRRMGRLAPAARAALGPIPPAVRAGLPVIVDGEAVRCPIVQQGVAGRAAPLARARLAAALGAYRDEASLWRVAKCALGA